jgi:hypothetical protein
MPRDYDRSMRGEENTPFVTEYEVKSITFVQKAEKCPLTGTHKI